LILGFITKWFRSGTGVSTLLADISHTGFHTGTKQIVITVRIKIAVALIFPFIAGEGW
jgi:hypothetical protein